MRRTSDKATSNIMYYEGSDPNRDYQRFQQVEFCSDVLEKYEEFYNYHVFMSQQFFNIRVIFMYS